MAIIRQKYSTNAGAVAFIKRSADVDATDPSTEPTTNPVDPNFYVSVSNARRKQGISARYVTLGRVIATAPNGSVLYAKAKITCLTPTGFTTLSGNTTSTIEYKGNSTWKVLGATPEG